VILSQNGIQLWRFSSGVMTTIRKWFAIDEAYNLQMGQHEMRALLLIVQDVTQFVSPKHICYAV
jgi:hypothetical protein